MEELLTPRDFRDLRIALDLPADHPVEDVLRLLRQLRVGGWQITRAHQHQADRYRSAACIARQLASEMTLLAGGLAAAFDELAEVHE